MTDNEFRAAQGQVRSYISLVTSDEGRSRES
jgi:hypothetical protein